jgi:hypothetical protein
MLNLLCGVDHCRHGYLFLEIGFLILFTILLGELLEIVLFLGTLVQEMIQGATCVAFKVLGWVSDKASIILIGSMFLSG